MIDIVDVPSGRSLEDYEAHPPLIHAVQELRAEAASLIRELHGRRIWMINSASRGGGVAEMLGQMVSLLRELGLDTRWVVLRPDRREFFDLTKHLHNLIHGEGRAKLSAEEHDLYVSTSRAGAEELKRIVGPDDVLVVHDPQPLAVGAFVRETLKVTAVWRCHIGADEENESTRAAWKFLEPFARVYDHAVFSAPEYIPSFLARRSSIIHPSIDPLSDKNRELSPVALVGILCNSGLVPDQEPVLTPAFAEPVRRLHRDGRFVPADQAEPIGLLFRPMVTQISRWDRLKGFLPLLRAFVRLKQRSLESRPEDPVHRRRLEIVRLILAGPDPSAIQDDPEGVEVLEELRQEYMTTPEEMQKEIAILSLPMASPKENAIIVNALQRCSTVIVQNSLREGFGLTVTEAMWKRAAVVGSQACGIRQQIRDGIDGVLLPSPVDPDRIRETLDRVLAAYEERRRWGRNAQRRVYDEFLIFRQLSKWLQVLALSVKGRKAGRRAKA